MLLSAKQNLKLAIQILTKNSGKEDKNTQRFQQANIILAILSIPGQACVLQLSSSEADPMQLAPPWAGAGAEHVLNLVFVPEPQV